MLEFFQHLQDQPCHVPSEIPAPAKHLSLLQGMSSSITGLRSVLMVLVVRLGFPSPRGGSYVLQLLTP